MLIRTFALLNIGILLISCRNLSKEDHCRNEFRRNTGLRKDFQIQKTILTDSQFVLHVNINDSALAELKRRFYFIPYKYYLESIRNLKRDSVSLYRLRGFDLANEDFSYYFAAIPSGSDYFMICLSKTNNHLIFAETVH